MHNLPGFYPSVYAELALRVSLGPVRPWTAEP